MKDWQQPMALPKVLSRIPDNRTIKKNAHGRKCPKKISFATIA
jgi:hypothetical protein